MARTSYHFSPCEMTMVSQGRGGRRHEIIGFRLGYRDGFMIAHFDT